MEGEITNSKEYQEFLKKLQEKREELRAFRFGVAGSKVKKVTDAKKIRKEIARILQSISILKKN
jgi:ribosomal protein L29